MSEESLEPLVTQCPNCDTRFRVTEAQLQIAHGRVRCGACLAVFDGTEHLSLDGEDFVPDDGQSDVDALLEELDHIPAEAAPAPSFQGADMLARDQHELLDGGDSVEDLPEELLALEAALMREMREGSPQARLSSETESAEEAPFQNSEADDQIEPPELIAEHRRIAGPKPPAESEDTSAADVSSVVEEDWLEEISDAWQAAESGATDETADTQDTEEVIELHALGIEPTGLEPPSVEPPQLSEDTAGGVTPGVQTSAIPTNTFFGDLDEEPTQRTRSWLTYVLLLLGIVGIPAQVLWYQYDAWVKDPTYRPIYQTLCDVASCELPPMRDISKIISKRSFIRAHPERADARIVDVLMVNDADFAQPFPLIELMATSMRGQLVAGRRFKPEEYLQGDMAKAKLFPPKTPIHVSLEIQDPGEDALNFEVKFR